MENNCFKGIEKNQLAESSDFLISYHMSLKIKNAYVSLLLDAYMNNEILKVLYASSIYSRHNFQQWFDLGFFTYSVA